MSKEPAVLTKHIRGLAQRLSKLEHEMKRQKEEFDAIKLTDKSASEASIAKARSSKNKKLKSG